MANLVFNNFNSDWDNLVASFILDGRRLPFQNQSVNDTENSTWNVSKIQAYKNHIDIYSFAISTFNYLGKAFYSKRYVTGFLYKSL